jgi:hypothetical protein
MLLRHSSKLSTPFLDSTVEESFKHIFVNKL